MRRCPESFQFGRGRSAFGEALRNWHGRNLCPDSSNRIDMCARARRTQHRARGHRKNSRSRVWLPLTVIAGGLAVAGVFGWLASPTPVVDPELPAWLPLCPVGAFPVNFTQRLETGEGVIFFCCPRCIEKYRAAPEEYNEAVDAQHAVLAKLPRVQVACPISGDLPDHTISRATKAGDIIFCSTECAAEFERDGDSLPNPAAVFTYQTTCPVSGRPIDPTWAIPVKESVSVYFCSEQCMLRYRESPDHYHDALVTQGFRGRF